MADRRTVLVTGASSGIGRALAGEFLARGWHVVATLRHAGTRGDLFADLPAAHVRRLTVLSLDVTDAGERGAVGKAVAAWPRGLDCLVNNAGYALFGALEDVSESQLRRQMEVNFFGAALLTRECLPALRQARGCVINVSSVLGFRGLPLNAAYCASKFALEGLSEALRHELRPHGVQVTLVEPGRHRTRFGEHAVWGEGSGRPDSPYARQSAAYRGLVARLARRGAAGPARVARTVVRLASMRRLPLRVRVGPDSRGLHLLGRLLPERVAWRVWAMACDRLFRTSAREPSGVLVRQD